MFSKHKYIYCFLYANNLYWQKKCYLPLQYILFLDTQEKYTSLLLGCVIVLTNAMWTVTMCAISWLELLKNSA